MNIPSNRDRQMQTDEIVAALRLLQGHIDDLATTYTLPDGETLDINELGARYMDLVEWQTVREQTIKELTEENVKLRFLLGQYSTKLTSSIT